MSVPYSYEDSMRVHDQAIWDWLETLHVDYGDLFTLGTPRDDVPVLKAYATPDRAYAALVERLVTLQWIPGANAADMREKAEDIAVLPLPFITIERGEPAPDPEFSGVPKVFRVQAFNQVTAQWEYHQWPGHYRTDYTLSVWTNKKYSEVFIREWVFGQLGKLGVGESEVLIPVKHKDPFGSWLQAMRFTGSSNLSELEGVEQRYMRFEYTFSLRTWIMKNSPGSGYVIDRIGQQFEQGDRVESIFLEETGRVDRESMNMFFMYIPDQFIPSIWPKTGTAEVSRSLTRPPDAFLTTDLEVKVTGDTDSVELLRRPITIDGLGYAIVSMSFEYIADEDVEFRVTETNPATNVATKVFTHILPETAKWKRVHFFTLVTQPIFTVEIAGLPSFPVATVNLYGTAIRHINNQTPAGTPPTPTAFIVGPDTDFVFSVLASEEFLVIGVVTAGSGVVEVRDDFGTPSFTSPQTIDAAVNKGFVSLIQPRATTVAVKIPSTLSIASVKLQRYDGVYKGHEI